MNWAVFFWTLDAFAAFSVYATLKSGVNTKDDYGVFAFWFFATIILTAIAMGLTI